MNGSIQTISLQEKIDFKQNIRDLPMKAHQQMTMPCQKHVLHEPYYQKKLPFVHKLHIAAHPMIIEKNRLD